MLWWFFWGVFFPFAISPIFPFPICVHFEPTFVWLSALCSDCRNRLFKNHARNVGSCAVKAGCSERRHWGWAAESNREAITTHQWSGTLSESDVFCSDSFKYLLKCCFERQQLYTYIIDQHFNARYFNITSGKALTTIKIMTGSDMLLYLVFIYLSE